MPFQHNEVGTVQYGGTQYWMVECGGGGDCLFLSAAWLLNHHQVPGHPYSADSLRTNASLDLVSWVQGNSGMPVVWTLEGNAENILNHQPTLGEAQAFGNTGVYGELPCIAAITAHLHAQGRDVEVHVLDGTRGEVHVLRSSNAVQVHAPAQRIHLWFEGNIHYRALVPNDRIDTVPARDVIANYATLFSQAPPRQMKPTASLQSSAQDGKTTALDIPAGTVLEIHHIDCEQGDATLFMIKDQKGVIRLSMLMDAGEKQGQVTAYFDTLIKVGNFRPLDVFVASHPDKDHIADSRNVLDDPRYTSEAVILYDNGLPPQRDREYNDVYLRNVHAARRRRPSLTEPILNDFMGITVECLACNGVMRNGYEPDVSPYWHHEGWDGAGRSMAVKRKGGTGTTSGGMEVEGSDHEDSDDEDFDDEMPVFDPESEHQMISAEYPSDKNDYSIALVVTFGKFTYFAAGDLGTSYEADLAHYVNWKYGPVSAWKAGHHGAQTSSYPQALGWLQGRFCALSFGTDNMHGHPHQATIDHLENLNTAGVPCTYYGTGTAQAATKERKPGTIGRNGSDGRGTIIIRAEEAVVKVRESFQVWTAKKNNGWETFDCTRDGARAQGTQVYVIASFSQGVPSKSLSTEQKTAKNARRTARAKLKAKMRDRLGRERYSTFESAIVSGAGKSYFEDRVSELADVDPNGAFYELTANALATQMEQAIFGG